MGVKIFLDILPYEIDEDKWEEVYEETLQLIEHYPFLDYVFDQETHGCPWQYSTRTKERKIGFLNDEIGWHILGDEKTLRTGESFGLARNLQYYRRNLRKDGKGDDILFSLSWLLPRELEERVTIKVNSKVVFNSKTQGEPFHIPMLAIACLIENRFPQHAFVRGDISVGQMKRAINWANEYLEKPIALPERIDDEKLLKRLKNQLDDETLVLAMLFSVTMWNPNPEMGAAIRKHLKQDAIDRYFIGEFTRNDLGTGGFSYAFRDFLALGFSLEDACDLCVLNAEGCQYNAAEFSKAILKLGWASKWSSLADLIPLEINAPDSEVPETVDSLMVKSFLQMAQGQRKLNSKLTIDDVAHILRQKFGDLPEISLTVKELKEKEAAYEAEYSSDFEVDEEIEKEIQEITAEVKEKQRMDRSYTISDPTNLRVWQEGDTIHPVLERNIANLKKYVEEFLESEQVFLEEFHGRSRQEKIQHLISRNKFFIIHRSVWEVFFKEIDNPAYINRVLAILSIKADEVNTNQLCKGMLNNQALYGKYIL